MVITPIFGYAQTEDRGELPTDALELQKSFEEAKERAIKPLELKYLKALKKLVTKHLKQGTTRQALFIQKEIDRINSKNHEVEHSEYLGEWVLKFDNGQFLSTRTLHIDGSLTGPDVKMASWSIKGKKLFFNYIEGHTAQFYLPIKDGALRGRTTHRRGVTIRLIKKTAKDATSRQ